MGRVKSFSHDVRFVLKLNHFIISVASRKALVEFSLDLYLGFNYFCLHNFCHEDASHTFQCPRFLRNVNELIFLGRERREGI